MIDAHAHPQLFQINNFALHTGVFAASTQKKDWHQLLQLQQCNPKIRVGIGVHPWWAHVYPHQERHQVVAQMDKLLFHNPKLFVGEVGLDRSQKHRATFAEQISILKPQLALAKKYDRSVVTHMVRASEDLSAVLQTYAPLRIYVHGFTGHPEVTKRFPGCWFGFTLATLRLEKVRKSVAIIPDNKILVESDGQVNWMNIYPTIKIISAIKGWSLRNTKKQLIKNALEWLNNS